MNPSEMSPASPEWGLAKRFLFRFFFCYFILYLFPFPLYYIPYLGIVAGLWDKAVDALVLWTGKALFHLDIAVRPNGSGDTTYNYVQLLCTVAVSFLVAAVWTLLERRHRSHPRLDAWLRVYVRFGLATVMISYGAIKVIQSQFPSPTLDRLLQPFGDASPMGLLWTFMGASPAYNFFGGLSEMLGGILLIPRRTALLGALVSAGVMANVVMLNFSYDVPVKLYSSHLLLMALFLAAPYLGRLAGLFVLNRPMAAIERRELFPKPWMNRAALVAKTVLVSAFVVWTLWGAVQQTRELSRERRSQFYGVWNVDELEVDGVAHPPLVTDESRWRRVVFDYPGMLAVQLMSDSRQRYTLRVDPLNRKMALGKRDDPDWKASLDYARPAPGLLELQGVLDGRKIHARLHRIEVRKFMLTSRGFHWINEYPFNR